MLGWWQFCFAVIDLTLLKCMHNKAYLRAFRVRTVLAKCSEPPSGMSSLSTDVSTI